MRLEVKLLQRRLNIAVLFVTHDQIEALSLSDTIAIMNLGVVQQLGKPRILYEQPANEFVRDFVGKTILFKGTVQSSNPSGQVAISIEGAPDCTVFGRGYEPDGFSDGQSVFMAIRPEDLDISAALSSTPPSGYVAATVMNALFIGERVEYLVEIPDQGAVTVYGERHEPIDEGGKAWLKVRPEGHSAWSTDWHKTDFEEIRTESDEEESAGS
jgi:ABC-type Fe3+/spermidine/putrescine transport system ATPase subunit